MNIEKIKKAKTQYLGKEIIYQEQMESTQDFAKKLEKSNLKHGMLIITDYQTKGRGTKGRTWHSNKDKNITMTIVLKQECQIAILEGFTIKIAEAIQKAIQNLYSYVLTIKQPNDLLLNGKKIGGILTECSSRNGKVSDIRIGIGFDVNQEEFEEELNSIATSLKKEYHQNFNREEIIIAILEEIEKLWENTMN